MSEYSRCKVCGFSINQNFNKATTKTKCQRGNHVFEQFVYCSQCHSTATRFEDAVNSIFCSVECQTKYASTKKPKKLITCSICGCISSSLRCRVCEDKLLAAQQEEIKAVFKVKTDAFSEYKNCKYGVCDIVKAHHQILQDDPNRLKSEFIIGLVCGYEGREFYLQRREDRLDKEQEHHKPTC